MQLLLLLAATVFLLVLIVAPAVQVQFNIDHSGILGFMTLIPKENENILVFEKSKWIRKQKLTSNIGFFLEFFPQLILTTESKNTCPDITVYY